ncbi:MAG: hypothetical protein K6B67_03845 [Lachnospiraceae bacterium]|nr:hypothetical protein [Lachnospiraceae bacterium]
MGQKGEDEYMGRLKKKKLIDDGGVVFKGDLLGKIISAICISVSVYLIFIGIMAILWKG